MISELKQCGITPNKLDEICGARTDNGEQSSRDDDGSRAQKQRPLAAGKLLNRKLTEIAGIYRGYEEAIEGHYIDTEDLAGLFISNIKDSRTVKDSLFWVYGFDVFSPKNLQALEMLIKHSRGVNVVLTYDEGCKDENLFAAVRETMDRLEKAAENVNVRTHISKISEGYLRPQYLSDKHIELAHLEKNLYAMPPGKLENSNGNQITLVRASSVYAEAETAASYVMKLVRDKGFAYRDIVIICNDKGPRAEIYKQTFSRYGIRLFADEKRRQARFGDIPEEMPDTEKSVERTAVERDSSFRIHMALHSLEEPYREVFELRVFGELSFSDVGKIFGKTENWARVTYHRARIRLQERMEKS
jgi:RNA polymerase sigma factor (sigma-70 family)